MRDRVFDFIQGSIEGELIAARLVTDHNGLQIGHLGFEQAAFIVAAFATVGIAHVNFDARDAVAKAIQEIADRSSQALLDIGAQAYVVIVIDLNLHADLVQPSISPIQPRKDLFRR